MSKKRSVQNLYDLPVTFFDVVFLPERFIDGGPLALLYFFLLRYLLGSFSN